MLRSATQRAVQPLNNSTIQRRKRQHSSRTPPTQAIFGLFQKAKPSKEKIEDKKAELLEVISELNRGVTADAVDRERVEELAQELEKLNPTRKPLASPLVNGKWELIYTTSDSILGTKKPPFLRPQGSIYQLIDAENLKAANRETWPFFNQVTAALTPVSDKEVAVQFKQFKILGLIPVTAPESAKGSLSVTFLDEEMRISRGDKGNLFVLLMDDPDARP